MTVEALYLLVPMGVIVVFVAAGVFAWAIREGQFDHLEHVATDVLDDE